MLQTSLFQRIVNAPQDTFQPSDAHFRTTIQILIHCSIHTSRRGKSESFSENHRQRDFPLSPPTNQESNSVHRSTPALYSTPAAVQQHPRLTIQLQTQYLSSTTILLRTTQPSYSIHIQAPNCRRNTSVPTILLRTIQLLQHPHSTT